MMGKTPGLTALSVLSLAVGIGLATAAFTVVYGIFLRPLPVPEGERMVRLWDVHRARRYNIYIPAEEFARRAAAVTSFEGLAAFYNRALPLESAERPPQIAHGAFITANAFALMSARAAQGRGLLPEDERPAAPPVVVLSHAVWQGQFGADPAILGRQVRVGTDWRAVVGVMPPGMNFPEREHFWAPLDAAQARATGEPLRVFGKLRQGVSIAQAEAELNVIGGTTTIPGYQPGEVAQRVMPYTRGLSGSDEAQFVLALVAVLTLLLMVAAANVANLMLARNAARVPELAVRSALGAGRSRLLGQLWLETFLLTSLGALLGTAAAQAGLAWLVRFRDFAQEMPWWADFRLSPAVLGFVFLLALLAATVAGLAPAIKVTRISPAEVMKSGAASIAGLRFGRLSAAMIVAEFALSVGLLGGAAVLGRGLLGFSYQQFGLPGQEVLVAQLYFGQPQLDAGASRDVRRAAWQKFEQECDAQRRRIEARLLAVPGVSATAVASNFPGNEIEPIQMEIEGSGSNAAGASATLTTRVAAAGERYFQVLGAPLLAGREFLPTEYVEPARVVIVNEPFARKHFAGRSPLGARVRVALPAGPPQPWMEIVGVVPDLGFNPGDPTRPEGLYIPQPPSSFLRLAVRSGRDARALIPAVHDAVLREAPHAQIQGAWTLEEQLREVGAVFQGIGAGLLLMGLIALLLSAASVFAIVSFSVTQRTREMGIRLALGATSANLLSALLGRPARQLALGAVLGLAIAAGVLQLVKAIPFDLQPSGPGPAALFGVFMLMAGLAACVVPARRALRIHPMDALRHE
jgi:predicted permease